MSLLVTCEMLGHFVNILIADDKYSLRIRENMFACLFSVNNTISLSRHEEVCFIMLCFERYSSEHLSKRSLIKYTCSLRNSAILPQPIQMQLSKKQIIFLNSMLHF